MELIVLCIGLISILSAGCLYFYVEKQPSGSREMEEISEAIREGAIAFLNREYRTLAVLMLAIAAILAIFLNMSVAVAYVLGSTFSGIAGFLGMSVAVKANVRTANAAKKGLGVAFPIAFYGGAVMGLSVVGFGIIGISLLYYIFHDLNIVLGFSLGASSMALFAKAGGGIYTKTADIGADIVGKIELGIPEDDPRNPAVIADNVGDNVGDVAGMGADIFDSYVASIISAMLLGAKYGTTGVILPMLFAAAGVIASIVGLFFVTLKRNNPSYALNLGTLSTSAILTILTYVVVNYLNFDMGVFYATIAGLLAGVVIGMTTDYYTSIDQDPVKRTASASMTGAGINILTGFSYGLMSILPPIVGISIATIAAYYFAGIYGIGMAAVGMLSIVGMIVSADAYGPIVDNAKGIAEQSGLKKEVIEAADQLDAVGNTSKAVAKGFAIGAAGLTVLALFNAYTEIVNIKMIDIMDPYVVVGVLIGAMIPALLSAMLILGVGKNAFRMVEEVRRQFKEIPGLADGKSKPDYAKCVDIATKGALQELALPSILAIISPLIVGLTLGKYALGGFLGGTIVIGIIFALFMANSGGIWDNAKKYIEAGEFGGEGSEAHKAAVVGDTVGDPFKDTAGPSLNTMITVMSLVASVFGPLIVGFSLIA